MSFLRELAHKQMDAIERESVARRLADYALGLSFDALPAEVVHTGKRVLLDALGCALGAMEAPGYPTLLDFIDEFGGPAEATVIGTGKKTSAFNATLVNSFLVRFLDYNDIGGGCHNSDAISNLLAVAERQKTSGREFLTALVASYELGIRVDVSRRNWSGWVRDLRAALTVPPAIGRLLGLDAAQIANAIGVLASANLTLGILDVSSEERSMRKNLRFGWTAAYGIPACLMAKHGFTGPMRVIEGEEGIADTLFDGEMDFEKMTDFRGYGIVHTRFKTLAACAALNGAIYATLGIVRDNEINPDDIAQVYIKIANADLASPSIFNKYPRNAESADHSAYYTNAVAIVNKQVGPESANPELFGDPRVVAIIEKMHVSVDPTIPPRKKFEAMNFIDVGRDGKSEIILKDGRRFANHVVLPHGFGTDPLTDAELEEKFTSQASRYMDKANIQKIIDRVWSVDTLDDMGEMMALMVASKNRKR